MDNKKPIYTYHVTPHKYDHPLIDPNYSNASMGYSGDAFGRGFYTTTSKQVLEGYKKKDNSLIVRKQRIPAGALILDYSNLNPYWATKISIFIAGLLGDEPVNFDQNTDISTIVNKYNAMPDRLMRPLGTFIATQGIDVIKYQPGIMTRQKFEDGENYLILNNEIINNPRKNKNYNTNHVFYKNKIESGDFNVPKEYYEHNPQNLIKDTKESFYTYLKRGIVIDSLISDNDKKECWNLLNEKTKQLIVDNITTDAHIGFLSPESIFDYASPKNVNKLINIYGHDSILYPIIDNIKDTKTRLIAIHYFRDSPVDNINSAMIAEMYDAGYSVEIRNDKKKAEVYHLLQNADVKKNFLIKHFWKIQTVMGINFFSPEEIFYRLSASSMAFMDIEFSKYEKMNELIKLYSSAHKTHTLFNNFVDYVIPHLDINKLFESNLIESKVFLQYGYLNELNELNIKKLKEKLLNEAPSYKIYYDTLKSLDFSKQEIIYLFEKGVNIGMPYEDDSIYEYLGLPDQEKNSNILIYQNMFKNWTQNNIFNNKLLYPTIEQTRGLFNLFFYQGEFKKLARLYSKWPKDIRHNQEVLYDFLEIIENKNIDMDVNSVFDNQLWSTFNESVKNIILRIFNGKKR